MSTPEPHPRDLPCSGSIFVAILQNFGASMQDAKVIWWHIYSHLVTDDPGSVPSYSIEEAVTGTLTYGALHDFFQNPSGVPLFKDMDARQRQFMLDAAQYLTQYVRG